jgi:hypothetical protein
LATARCRVASLVNMMEKLAVPEDEDEGHAHDPDQQRLAADHQMTAFHAALGRPEPSSLETRTLKIVNGQEKQQSRGCISTRQQ